MIVVIADDFTGAAEIAGLGLQYGLSVTVVIEKVREVKTDLLIIATDTRSLSREDAYKTIRNIKEELSNIEYDWLFKKTDSVFRGHVLEEIKAILDVNKKNTVLLVASNPQIGRQIINGEYFIDGIPLSKTEFANDPEYPVNTSDVFELIGKNGNNNIKLLSKNEEMLNEGLFIGEAGTIGDLKKFAAKVNSSILPAGASGFFAALLEKNGFQKQPTTELQPLDENKKYLIIQGSSYNKKKLSQEIFDQENILISNMPKAVFYNEDNFDEVFQNWLREIVTHFKNYNKVFVRISEPVIKDINISNYLKQQLANLVSEILELVSLDELIIDGGGTAYAVVSKLKYLTFLPIKQVAPGVIRMRAEGNDKLRITIKPGSYTLPETLYI